MQPILSFITAHKLQSLALFLILPLLGVGVYLAMNQTALRSRASTGTEPEFLFSPATQTIAIGGTPITIDVVLDFKRKPVIFFTNEIQYDQNVFEITAADVKPGPLFARSDGSSLYGVFPPNSIKVENGTIKYSWLALDPNTKAKLRGLLDQFQSVCTSTGTGDDCRITLAKITLKPKVNAASGNSRLIFGAPDKNFVFLADDLGTSGAPPKHGIVTTANSKELNINVTGGTVSTPAPTSTTPVIACSLSVDKTTGTLTDSFTFTLSSPSAVGSSIPSGSQLSWGGTNNGQAIQSSSAGTFSSSPQVVGTFTGNNFGGAGTYTRFIQVRQNGNQICQTTPVTVTVQSQGAPARSVIGPNLVNSDPTAFSKVCQAKGLGASCVFDTISHIDGWDRPWQNEEFITIGNDFWIFGPIVNGSRAEIRGKVNEAFPEVCSDTNCSLTSVSQFKGYDNPSQNDVLIIKGDRYWIYQPVNASNIRPAPVSGAVSSIDGVSEACSGLTNCQVDTISHYRNFDTADQNQAFIIVHGTRNGQQVARFAISEGLLKPGGIVASSRGTAIAGDLTQFSEVTQLCSNNPNCIIKAAAQYKGFDTPTQNQDLMMAVVNGEGKFIVRNGLNSTTTNRPTPPPSAAPVKYTIADAQAMIAAWGPITAGNRATNGKWDLNSDNVVNIRDWAILYANKQ